MKISICISTYNGQLFFDEQINSILNQTYKDFEIIIRDDGSSDDRFIEQLKEYEKQYNNVKVYLEPNIGVAQSFFELFKKVPLSSDFVVLADQDDFWYPTRLENTMKFIEKQKIYSPLLCFCSFEYVDDTLNFISDSPIYKHIGFNNALVQNLAAGCTICINNAALKILLLYTPEKSVIHDWWIYLVVSATGKVIQEPNISIKYRQHRFNILGGTTSAIEKNKKRLKRKLNLIIYKVYDQVQEFYCNYHDFISIENRGKIERFLQTNKNFASKCLFIFDNKTVIREKIFDNILLKIIILLSRIEK
jgi:glycosyltransferase involved in cell wall biosynthesis